MDKCTRFIKAMQVFIVMSLAVPLAANAELTDNNDGTVTDTATGLMWDQCSRSQDWAAGPPPTCSNVASGMTWSAALTEAVTANSGNHRGYNDWRLPNKNELLSLILITTSDPAIDVSAFPGTLASLYWSSTTYTTDPANAWSVSFFNGELSDVFKSSGLIVRLVRSGL